MPKYSHTLIPLPIDFVPEPGQVANFLSSLVSGGFAPLSRTISLSIPTGEVQTNKNPFTGKTSSRPLHKRKEICDLAEVPGMLTSLESYSLFLAGQGPPEMPAIALNFQDAYAFAINCCLRAEVVSTSDWHAEVPLAVPLSRTVEAFGHPREAGDEPGVFHNPDTLAVIEVPGAGCARFWVEFEYGKSLFPVIEDRLDFIEPRIVEIAQTDFGVEFVQGCLWCS